MRAGGGLHSGGGAVNLRADTQLAAGRGSQHAIRENRSGSETGVSRLHTTWVAQNSKIRGNIENNFFKISPGDAYFNRI